MLASSLSGGEWWVKCRAVIPRRTCVGSPMATKDEPQARPAKTPTLPSAPPRICPLGDAALTVDFGEAINPALNAAVLALEQAVAAAELPGLIETAPSYRALTILYDPAAISFAALAARLRALLEQGDSPCSSTSTAWVVPLAYDPPHGLDTGELAQHIKLSSGRIRSLHAAALYTVYMVGFAPGLTYLGGLPSALWVPRRLEPRPPVPAGSVLVGGQQAAIVSMPVPTGWYVLGRTPLRAFDADRADPFLFRPGDTVRFRPIASEEFDRLAALPTSELPVLAQGEVSCQRF